MIVYKDSEELYNSQIEEYEGRYAYYQITLNSKLDKNNCKSNCLLCLKDTSDYCITSKYNYTLEKINNESSKICSDYMEETDLLTVKTTFIEETDINTEKISYIEKADNTTEEVTLIEETDFISEKKYNIIKETEVSETET